MKFKMLERFHNLPILLRYVHDSSCDPTDHHSHQGG